MWKGFLGRKKKGTTGEDINTTRSEDGSSDDEVKDLPTASSNSEVLGKGFLGRKKKGTTEVTRPIEEREDINTTRSEDGSSDDDVKDLLTASSNSEVLGKGTFGTSYKMKSGDADTFVVKRLKDVAVGKKDFKKQMQTVGSIIHENVATARAYYYSKDEKFVVYDYFEQGSVSDMLHGKSGFKYDRTPLDWNTRVKIVVGAARGIAYIHTQNGGKLVHGNVKASNVFLNSQGYGCVSDVGLGTLMNPMPLPGVNNVFLNSQGYGCVSDVGLETLRNPIIPMPLPEVNKGGYGAPEMTDTSKTTPASDIYSFGVLLLELLTAKSPIGVVMWVRSVIRENWVADAFDNFDVDLSRFPRIKDDMVKMLQIGLSCTAKNPEQRPKMKDVVTGVDQIGQLYELPMPKLNEDVEIVARIPQATNETEPTFSNSSEEFHAAEAITKATTRTSHRWKYDLFLSFRGEDTRQGFLSHLYHELQNTKVIRTFKDDQQLKKGKDISQSLLTAIEESRFAMIILSKNYASSTWCLNELTKICDSMGGKETILPVFYHVDPSEVRNQKNSFEEAFTIHESMYDIETVKNWRVALQKVSRIAGWDSKNYKTERELVEHIVHFVSPKVLELPKEEFEEFGAAKDAVDEVTKALQDDKITVIGVHGEGGVGKTTVVKYVSAEAKKNRLFYQVVMVLISRSPDLGQIQGTLADFLGLNLVEDSQLGRANRLKETIMGRKKLLIILDDIWERIDLSSIGIPDHNELQSRNSKVILTTRIIDVCPCMGCQAQITLNILSEQDSFKLFMNESGKICSEFVDSSEAKMVIRECTGLPNALKAAARAVGHKYLVEWNNAVAEAFGDDNSDEWKEGAQQEQKSSQPFHHKNEGDLKNIRFKYDTLISDDAKSCFLLCSLFLEDWDIPIDQLLKYAIGIGLFRCSDTMQEARYRANSVVKHLIASGLLLNGTEKGCIRMPVDSRHVALSIMLPEESHAFFVKAGCDLKDWPVDAHEGYSGISLMVNKLHKLPEKLVCSKLQILLLQSNHGIFEIPETFIQKPNELRVFDLSFTNISFLPTSFSLLINLQALFLDCCHKIRDISILEKLKKLEILSMRGCCLKEFPKQIEHLTNLRMLDVTGGRFDSVPSNVISRLHRLEELYMKCGFGDWGSKVENAVDETDNADFNEITALPYLNILKVNMSDTNCLPKSVEYVKLNWVDFDICIGRDVRWETNLSHSARYSSRILIINTTIKSLPDWFNKVVTNRAEKLVYKDYSGLTDIFVEHDLGGLHELKYLSVNGAHENLKVFMNAVPRNPFIPVFESLEELHIFTLQCLEKLCVGELPPGSLSNLKLLKVQTCRSMVNALLPLNLLHSLLNLEAVICVNLEQMRYVFGFEGLQPDAIVLEILKEIRLCALPELKSIWNGPAPHVVFQNLKILAVCECKELKNLFPLNVAQSLVQLEDLCVEHCPNLDRVIEASNCLNSRIVLLKLKKLTLISLPELSWFCTETGTVDIECPSLEHLYMDKCPKFSYPHSPSVKTNDQQHLDSIVKRWQEMHKL